ncbi:MAG: hypothetical protein U0804_13970 [Gemmataceae bacterium]
MTTDPDALVAGYLDGTLTADEEAALNDWVKADPAHAARFAAAARVHDRLGDVFRMSLPAATPAPARPRARLALGGLIAALAAALLLAVWLTPTRVTAAAELDRLIASSAGAGDRTYTIRTLDPDPEAWDERRQTIDGATLHVRPPERYVLVRRFPDGQPFVTGSDGARSWSVPPAGAVRVSGDPLRFRGPVPGHQHGIPFADLRGDLVQLRDAYALTVLPPDAAGRRGLRAVKRSNEFRGPREVELWYDPATGVIERMTFAGLPRARGGPDRLAVELRDTAELGADFFTPTRHHAPDRRVIEED